MFRFYTPWKRKKTKGFSGAVSGGTETEHWAKVG